jgi:predicted metalloprotease with PDZ domain
MKAMYDTYYVKENRGFTDAEFMEMASKIAGKPLDDIYRAATTASTPDYQKYLGYAGLELIDLNEGTERVDLGARTTVTDGRIAVSQVLRGTAAWDAGINVRDELIAINGFRLDAAGKELERLLREQKAGDQIKVLVARDGLLQEIPVTLQQDRNKRFVIMPVPNPTAKQVVVRNKWLKL